jgi:phytoene dehydrogenase-like protein
LKTEEKLMPKSVIIIGAGVAGLAAGCYAQMNGYDSQIFELHDLPGGLCTAWERKGFRFDGCLHYLFGSGPGQPFHQMWRELGAIQDRPVVNHAELMHVVDEQGQRLIVYANPDELEAHMCQLSPADSHLIQDLCAGIRQFTSFDLSCLQETPRDLMSADEWRELGFSMLPYVQPLARWGMLSAADFARKFKDSFLQQAVALMFSWPEAPVMVGMQLLASLYTQNAGFPLGGSLEFARMIEQRYLALGGRIHYKAQVEKILVENGRASGVRLYNDEIHLADTVISAADGHGTLFDMLGEEYVPGALRKRYNGHLPVRPVVQVSFGLNRDLSHEPHWAHYLLPNPVLIGGLQHTYLSVKHYSFDPEFAPAGKASLVVLLPASYAYWQRIYGRRLYDTEQIQVEEQVLAELERVYPGISGQVEVSDVATPLSYERYTGNWQGSSCGWLLTKDTMLMLIKGVSKTLPGLKDFYMAGQWVEPGGSVPVAAMSGRNAIQLLCHAAGQEFQSETP